MTPFSDILRNSLDRGYLPPRTDIERAVRTPDQQAVFDLADSYSGPAPAMSPTERAATMYGEPRGPVDQPLYGVPRTTRVAPVQESVSGFNDTVRGIVDQGFLPERAPLRQPPTSPQYGPILSGDSRFESMDYLSPLERRDFSNPQAPEPPQPLPRLQMQPPPEFNFRRAQVYDPATGYGTAGSFDMTEVSDYTGPQVDRATGVVNYLPSYELQNVGSLATGYGPQTTLPTGYGPQTTLPSMEGEDGYLPPIDPQGTTLSNPLDYIFESEARKDRQGRLQVYNLPRADGGGAYEVAGINQRFHPRQAAALRSLIQQGRHAEAEQAAKTYIGEYTNPVTTFAANPGSEYALRDAYFNRGPGGAYWMAKFAAGLNPTRSMSAEDRQSILTAQQADPAGFLRRLHTAAEQYESRFAGYRPQFARGLQNRWNERLKNSLALLESGGNVPGMQSTGFTLQPQSVTPPQQGIPMGAQNQPVQTFSSMLPTYQMANVGGMPYGSPQMGQQSPMVSAPAPSSTYGRAETGFQLPTAPMESPQGQQAPSPLAAALQGATQVIEGLSDPQRRASTPLGSLFFSNDAASDQPQTNIGSGSMNAMPTNVPAAFGNKTVYSNATGPTGDNQDESMPIWQRLFGAI